MSTLTSSQRTALLAALGLTSIAALVAWKRSQCKHTHATSPIVAVTEDAVDLANKEISNAQRQREKEIKEGKRPPTKPHAERPRLTGTTKISVPHLYAADDREKLGIIHPTWEVELSNDDLQFELNPGYLGEGPSRFLYLNAQDVEWYKQQLPAPTLIVWVMCKRGLFLDVAYAKRRLMEEAFKLNIQIVNINPRKLDIYYPASPTDDSQWLMYEKKLIARPHAVLTRAGANIDYFGRCAIRHLESLGIKVFNDMASLDISRDKLYTHQILCPYGVPVPKSILTQLPVEISYVEKHFTYPIILKSTYGSLGEQVWKADNREELEKLLPTMDYDKPLIFQEFVANSSGRDLRIFVVGDHVAAAMMRMAPTGFKANIAQGGTAKRVNIEPQLEHMAVQVTKRCKLDMAGIDVLMDKGTYKICEVNASPLFEGLERATGVNVAYAIMSYIKEWCHERGIGNR